MKDRKKLTAEDILEQEQMNILLSNNGYIKAVSMAIESVAELNPKDRLEYASSIAMLVAAIKSSIKGWEKWCDPITLNGFTLEQFQEIFPDMQKITKRWLEIDKEVTVIKTKQLQAELNKLKKEKKKKSDSSLYM